MLPGFGKMGRFRCMQRKRVPHIVADLGEIRARHGHPAHYERKDIMPACEVLRADHGITSGLKDAKQFSDKVFRPV